MEAEVTVAVRATGSRLSLHETVLDVTLLLPLLLHCLSVVFLMVLGPGFCPRRHLPSSLLHLVSGKLHPGRIFLVSHPPLHIGFLVSGAKAQSFFMEQEILGSEKPATTPSFPWAML